LRTFAESDIIVAFDFTVSTGPDILHSFVESSTYDVSTTLEEYDISTVLDWLEFVVSATYDDCEEFKISDEFDTIDELTDTESTETDMFDSYDAFSIYDEWTPTDVSDGAVDCE
jgi:hypothetical protein